MPESKEQAILEAAIHEFAAKGYEQASTNQIAKQAKTSKGLVFHYFESKEKLYDACIRYAIHFTMKELDYENWPRTNRMIDDLRDYCERELSFLKKYSDIYPLLAGAIANPPDKLAGKMGELFGRMTALSQQYFADMIDRLNLKEDVDRSVLQAVVQSHLEYYNNHVMGYLKLHPDAMFEEMMPFFEQFIEMLKLSLQGLLKDDGK